MRRPYSEWTPLGVGFYVILGDDQGNRAPAAFDYELGWKDATDPREWRPLSFKPTGFEVMDAPE